MRSMTPGMRRLGMVLSALTLAVSLVFAGVLYQVGSGSLHTTVTPNSPAVTRTGESDEALTTNAPPPVAGAERIDDEANPLAAPSAAETESPESTDGLPVSALLGAAVALVGGFFVLRIRRVNRSITHMRRTIRS